MVMRTYMEYEWQGTSEEGLAYVARYDPLMSSFKSTGAPSPNGAGKYYSSTFETGGRLASIQSW